MLEDLIVGSRLDVGFAWASVEDEENWEQGCSHQRMTCLSGFCRFALQDNNGSHAKKVDDSADKNLLKLTVVGRRLY